MVLGIPPKPGQLFSGVFMGIEFQGSDCLLKAQKAVEVVEHLFVAHRVECIQAAVGVEAFGFHLQTPKHHFVHATVDTIVEFLPVPVQANLQDVEGPFFCRVLAKGGSPVIRHISKPWMTRFGFCWSTCSK